MSFDTFCGDVARKFIQTVMVIDDRARLTELAPPTVPDAIVLPGGRTFADRTPLDIDLQDPEIAEAEIPLSPEESHALDGMRLTRSFAKLGVACSIYVPEQTDVCEDVNDTARVARHADVVVLDWKLGTGSSKARAIIRRILSEDALERGRLRLIAVYTGETNLPALRDQVSAELVEEGIDVKSTDGPVALGKQSLRIVFINKAHAGVPLAAPGVDETGLPERLVAEFARMSQGIMPAVALGSITALRNSSHHVLAKFHSGLDGALAAHRALLKTPEDAEAYATDLVAEELRAILEATDVGVAHAGIAVFTKWVTHKDAIGHKFFGATGASKGLTPDEATELLRIGSAQHTTAGQSCRPTVGKKKFANSAAAFFYADTTLADAANLEFSRMAALKREAYGNSFIPENWAPTLTLGSVVMQQDDPSGVFACIQPVCDAVRITGQRRFPLVPLKKADAETEFSLVLRFQDDSDVCFEPDYHPYSLIHKCFSSNPCTGTVRAVKQERRFFFETVDGRCFEWIADLKYFFAQRLIQRSAGQVDRVGLDEYEWLRGKGKKHDD